jgi:hypothetical protein
VRPAFIVGPPEPQAEVHIMDQDRDSLGTFAPIRRKLQAQMRALWLHGLLVVYMTFNAG